MAHGAVYYKFKYKYHEKNTSPHILLDNYMDYAYYVDL